MRARWLGRVPYAEAWDLQRALAGGRHDYLLLLEHEAVYTLGVHADRSHVLVDPASVGAAMISVDRGGDVTYHGPGQLVGYPIRTVGPGMHRGPEHVRDVEDVVIGALVALGIPGHRVGRLSGFPGVWLDPDGTEDRAPRKIAAVGVRTARGRTTHGFALNVSTDLSMFGHIVPCGIADRPTTSLAAEGLTVSMADAVAAVIDSASSVWGPMENEARVTDGARRSRDGGFGVAAGQAADGAPAGSDPTGVPVLIGRKDRPPESGTGPASDALVRRMGRAGMDPAAGIGLSTRKPEWLRVPATMGRAYLDLRRDLRQLDLVTVCEEAGCPNIYECWSDGTATFMINGSRCTRACGFCQVDTRHPLPLDPTEPARVAEAVSRLGLAHAVVTCVARDDLADGGAGAFAETVAAIRAASPGTSVEVLISDLKGDRASLQTVLESAPDVLNHNIETVARLQRVVRPSAGYARSLTVLARSSAAGCTTKSGMILGMGEGYDEVLATLADLRDVGVDIVTLGQYLRPSAKHLPVARWWTPAEFDDVREAAEAMGFAHVQASPLTRSSYHAREAAASAPSGAVPVRPMPVAGSVR